MGFARLLSEVHGPLDLNRAFKSFSTDLEKTSQEAAEVQLLVLEDPVHANNGLEVFGVGSRLGVGRDIPCRAFRPGLEGWGEFDLFSMDRTLH